MRRAAKVDTNQAEIVEALRRAGYSVQHLHSVGRGCPDILCGGSGLSGHPFNVLLELKSTPTVKLTDDEKAWHADWRGQVDVVCDAQQAVLLMHRIRSYR